MGHDQDAVDEIFSHLEEMGELRARRMFGGTGLYCDDVFFALIAEGVLFFKVDEGNVGVYEAAGSAPFQPYEQASSKPFTYYEVPVEVQESPATLRTWAAEALAAARRRNAKKKRKPKRAPRDPAKQRVKSLLNVGPKSAAWLASVGIKTRADLERLGSVGAYRLVCDAGLPGSLLLLYALEGALLDLRWDRLPEAIKSNLRERAASSGTRRRKS